MLVVARNTCIIGAEENGLSDLGQSDSGISKDSAYHELHIGELWWWEALVKDLNGMGG